MSMKTQLVQHPPVEVAVINRTSDDMSDDGRKWKDGAKIALFSALIVIGGISLTLVLLLQRKEEAGEEYGVVFDAGSSHTALYVYKWAGNERLKGTAVPVNEVFNNMTIPGISSFSEEHQNPHEAGSSLKDLIKQALGVVPSNIWSSTPVFLGATAGMRLVEEVNSTISNQIMSSVHEVLAESGFQFANNHSKIITGEDEGAFGWITVNYLKKVLQTTSKHLPSAAGALDLGGASTQISFVPENGENTTKHFVLYGRNYPVYTKTYLCYGLNEIYRRFLAELAKNSNYTSVVPNPCAHKTFKNVTKNGGFLWGTPCSCQPTPSVNHSTFTFVGSPNSSECTHQVARLFNFNNTCPKAKAFSRKNQPPLTGNFLAFSGYYWKTLPLNLSSSPTIDEFKSAYEKVCNNSSKGNTSIVGDVSNCFAAQYIYALLTQGYGFDNKTWNITIKKNVDKKSLGWTLGYMINATNLIPLTKPENKRLRNEIFIPVLAASAIFILIGLLFCARFIYRKKHIRTDYLPF